jgi:hypothetical protein
MELFRVRYDPSGIAYIDNLEEENGMCNELVVHFQDTISRSEISVSGDNVTHLTFLLSFLPTTAENIYTTIEEVLALGPTIGTPEQLTEQMAMLPFLPEFK